MTDHSPAVTTVALIEEANRIKNGTLRLFVDSKPTSHASLTRALQDHILNQNGENKWMVRSVTVLMIDTDDDD